MRLVRSILGVVRSVVGSIVRVLRGVEIVKRIVKLVIQIVENCLNQIDNKFRSKHRVIFVIAISARTRTVISSDPGRCTGRPGSRLTRAFLTGAPFSGCSAAIVRTLGTFAQTGISDSRSVFARKPPEAVGIPPFQSGYIVTEIVHIIEAVIKGVECVIVSDVRVLKILLSSVASFLSILQCIFCLAEIIFRLVKSVLSFAKSIPSFGILIAELFHELINKFRASVTVEPDSNLPAESLEIAPSGTRIGEIYKI